MDGARWGPPGWLCWAAASAASTLQHLQRLAAPVQLNLGGGRGATQAHYGPGEIVFNEGDTGDSLFMIISDRVEVLKRFGGEPRLVGELGPGEYFGEMALLGRRPRSAGARALTPLDLLVLLGSDFSALADSLTEFRSEFEEIARARAESDAARAAGGA